jgi:hypothetical protein
MAVASINEHWIETVLIGILARLGGHHFSTE